ncbi:uncharacterized protein AMSG_01023 [Thecamonas trahens ATCC 50062]|uniref:Uncharacterized protein n=1 Tax=Thecamonas trahens ATCC 50062 TaxID=461836 RepID=A0A0L0DJF2_THETB|nr:hypothetical protein AMSG_01023 [Thecamonas trahens ATCC 50062]KNC52196.1 hypothetical protein AMSG_01023 [Thecamonas trahens ATCC 50062]|eukprot:XP_013762199.1 hypothetical protein AMSG_01023 [Thecamonas trahens ATCC 50062]
MRFVLTSPRDLDRVIRLITGQDARELQMASFPAPCASSEAGGRSGGRGVDEAHNAAADGQYGRRWDDGRMLADRDGVLEAEVVEADESLHALGSRLVASVLAEAGSAQVAADGSSVLIFDDEARATALYPYSSTLFSVSSLELESTGSVGLGGTGAGGGVGDDDDDYDVMDCGPRSGSSAHWRDADCLSYPFIDISSLPADDLSGISSLGHSTLNGSSEASGEWDASAFAASDGESDDEIDESNDDSLLAEAARMVARVAKLQARLGERQTSPSPIFELCSTLRSQTATAFSRR